MNSLLFAVINLSEGLGQLSTFGATFISEVEMTINHFEKEGVSTGAVGAAAFLQRVSRAYVRLSEAD